MSPISGSTRSLMTRWRGLTCSAAMAAAMRGSDFTTANDTNPEFLRHLFSFSLISESSQDCPQRVGSPGEVDGTQLVGHVRLGPAQMRLKCQTALEIVGFKVAQNF